MNDDCELSIIITLPAYVNWEDYKKEITVAENGGVMNFKVPGIPTEVGPGAKCYITWRGFIRGYMLISGFSEKQFTCTTTGRKYTGKFIERTGKFYPVEREIPYKGFQGFRYIRFDEYVKQFESEENEEDTGK